jgi:hypothetical protein
VDSGADEVRKSVGEIRKREACVPPLMHVCINHELLRAKSLWVWCAYWTCRVTCATIYTDISVDFIV